VAGSVGSLAGAVFWYWIGRRLTHEQLCTWTEKHGAWIAMTPEDVGRAVKWFEGHGRYTVLLGRLFPVVRTLISVPAGFSRMPLPRFLLLSAVGTAVWTAGLAYAGRLLGQKFDRVEQYIGPVSWVVIGGALLWYLYRVWRIRRQRPSGGEAS
jgi:membrane protein DedA with SNARE-associated domain